MELSQFYIVSLFPEVGREPGLEKFWKFQFHSQAPVVDNQRLPRFSKKPMVKPDSHVVQFKALSSCTGS
jgi:hypothetical protein